MACQALHVTYPVETGCQLGLLFFSGDIVDVEFRLDDDDGAWTKVFRNVVCRYGLALDVCGVVLQ